MQQETAQKTRGQSGFLPAAKGETARRAIRIFRKLSLQACGVVNEVLQTALTNSPGAHH